MERVREGANGIMWVRERESHRVGVLMWDCVQYVSTHSNFNILEQIILYHEKNSRNFHPGLTPPFRPLSLAIILLYFYVNLSVHIS